MHKMPAEKVCTSCARSLPVNTHYTVGATLCADCDAMPRAALVDQTIETVERRLRAKRAAVSERRMALQVQRLTAGKRCDCCRAYKPVSGFAKCAPRNDGLQPTCRTCFSLRAQHARNGGTVTEWHALRERMRAANAGALPLNVAVATSAPQAPEHALVTAYRQAGTDTDRAALRAACAALGLAVPGE